MPFLENFADHTAELPTHDEVLVEIARVETGLAHLPECLATDLEIAKYGEQKAYARANPARAYLSDDREFFYQLLDEIEAEAVHAEALEAEFAGCP